MSMLFPALKENHEMPFSPSFVTVTAIFVEMPGLTLSVWYF